MILNISVLQVGKTAADIFKRHADEVSPLKRGGRWEQIRLKGMASRFLFSTGRSRVRAQDHQPIPPLRGGQSALDQHQELGDAASGHRHLPAPLHRA